LIANRGEIAIRIARAAAELGIASVAVFSADDAESLHVRAGDDAHQLAGSGPAAYLDGDALVRAALERGCDALHPGYGFLSENADFARACEAAGLVFVGPSPETLEMFGDKARARELARGLGVPLAAGTFGATSLPDAAAFFDRLDAGDALMVKAVAGGGGRGMRLVRERSELEEAFERARSEAVAAFGNGDLYVERFFARARHIEVQIAGDASGAVTHLFERECTLQRRNQKLVEIAPAPWLDPEVRERLIAASLELARAARFRNLGTFEFLVGASDGQNGAAPFAFLEANARLQVEHTVTEETTGVDLVQLQLRLAAGDTLETLGVGSPERIAPRGFALQARVNLETMLASGEVHPSGGTLSRFDVPTGPGIRVDTFGYAGYTTNPRFDSLLAKVVVRSNDPGFAALLPRARRALADFEVEGAATNLPFLRRLLDHPAIEAGPVTTRFVEEQLAQLVPPENELAGAPSGLTGAQPGLAADGTYVAVAPVAGRIVSIDVRAGDTVRAGGQLAVLDAMKMEHVVSAELAGIVRSVDAAAGDIVFEGRGLVTLEPADVGADGAVAAVAYDPAHVRHDLAETLARQAATRDEARPAAVARRRKTGQRTARENVADLFDAGTFVEYGALILPAQRRRRALNDLIENYPADGLVCGIGDVNGADCAPERARTMVLAYDYTVLAGTQGMLNHKKTDRMLDIAERHRLPIVFFCEGGGGRPGDTDWVGVGGLDVMTFAHYARLSGLMPRVGIVSGRCFAGNAALLGCSDVVIATEDATIGMGGPAMIEGGGLGVFKPEEVGPVSAQVPSGVIDVLVPDEAAAVAAAKHYLSYFQGDRAEWTCADQGELRGLIPENRLRVYDVRRVVETLADTDSVLELRRGFAPGMVTALARIEGKPVGLIANNPLHLAGAIDSTGADKAARFLQLCDAFGLPVVFLCDTPGIMVGPDAERTGLVRHASRLFVTAGTLSVPLFTIVLRKGYGLGAQAMAGGSFHAGSLTVSWPTGEFGAMGLEGSVRLGFRKELESVEDEAERRALFERMVAEAYENGKALNMATFMELDDVIDPADSRRWIRSGLQLRIPDATLGPKRRTMIDTW
jgi:acetyl/propionyl-CoA carboxylase alpha subunit